MTKKPMSLRYYGGKARGKGTWIASILPDDYDRCYIEPFSGMFSVLLARQPVKREIINDVNSRVITWARAVRDHPEEFGYLIEHTLHSQEEFIWAIDNIDNPEIDDLRRALAFHITVSLSIQGGDSVVKGSFRRAFSTKTGSIGKWNSERVDILSQRLFNVQILCEDALQLLGRTKDKERCVIYCDPPYPTSNTSPYSHNKIDKTALSELLLNQQGAVAISGYADEWDHLEWTKHIKDVAMREFGSNAYKKSQTRTEILWTNF